MYICTYTHTYIHKCWRINQSTTKFLTSSEQHVQWKRKFSGNYFLNKSHFYLAASSTTSGATWRRRWLMRWLDKHSARCCDFKLPDFAIWAPFFSLSTRGGTPSRPLAFPRQLPPPGLRPPTRSLSPLLHRQFEGEEVRRGLSAPNASATPLALTL